MNYYLQALKNYSDFSSRARRSEYWFFVLFNLLFSMVAILLDFAINIAIGGMEFLPIISILYLLTMIVPALAVTVRRLHDTGKSGWFYFISLIPLVGAIWLFVIMVTDGEPGENKYGPNPKEAAKAESNPNRFKPEPSNLGYSPVMNRSTIEDNTLQPNGRGRLVDSQVTTYGWLVQHSENQKPKAFPLTQDLTLIGRDAGAMRGQNGILKIDNDGTVSRKHVAVRVEFKAANINYILEDLGSSNGTYVMNTRTKVQPLQPFYLTDGDQIKTGDTLFTFKTALSTPTELEAIQSARHAVLNRV